MVLVFAFVVVTWLTVGAGVAVFMVRRGHDAFTWLMLGVAFGPFAVLLASDELRRDRSTTPEVRACGADAGGPLDVLVGVDGSEASIAAARTISELLGARLGRLTLAHVVDGEAAQRIVGGREDAEEILRRAADRLADLDPRVVLLTGAPDRALAALAVEEGHELLVVAPHGSGGSHWLGGVATRLACTRPGGVPVVVCAPGSPPPVPRPSPGAAVAVL